MNPLPCAHKKAYLCPESAAKAAKGRTRSDPSLHLRVYACPECGAFHLTHTKHFSEQKGHK